MRLDHLLSKESSKGCISAKVPYICELEKKNIQKDFLSGGDARRGNTRSHPEHDGQALYGRRYYTGDGMEE